MHCATRRTGRGFARRAFFCILTLVLLGTGASAASAGADEAAVRSAALSFLRNYQEAALLYEDRDLRANTVADPSLVLPEGSENAVFRIGKKDVTLARLRENIAYLEKKAAYYAGMRQLQGIYRENLELNYALEELEIEDNVCRASVTATAGFRYTDSDLPSVYETGYSVRLVRMGRRWLVADLADGSQFDKTYKDSGTLDVAAALEEFAGQLAADRCTVSFSGQAPGSGDWIEYNGADAAAYAYTYSRQKPGGERADFYNPRFFSYAGEGGDCQNFVSQCMWAGFGGSEDSGSVAYHSLPMDNAGSNQWFGRPASGGTVNHSWISCQSFRQYLTGSRDGSGLGGSNAAGDAGMYAAILDVGPGSALSAAAAEELVGAAAHVNGSGGAYSHAVIFTAATGVSRSQIWFCGHTRDVTNLKLGDVYTGPVKVYIPRYLRTGGAGGGILRAERLQPVAAGETGVLTARTGGTRRQMSITVTPPGGTAERVAVADDADSCRAEYRFDLPGLYRVDYRAGASEDAPAAVTTCYVRCYVPDAPPEDGVDGWPEEAPEDGAEEAPEDGEIPGWLLA